MIELPMPEEPIEIKNRIVAMRKEFGKRGEWADWDSLATWYGNKLPSYLWEKWKTTLKNEGFTWQSFLKLMSYSKQKIIKWAFGGMDWKELVNAIIEDINGSIGRIVKRA